MLPMHPVHLVRRGTLRTRASRKSSARILTVSDSGKEQQYDRFVSLLARNEPSVRAFVRSLLPSAQDTHDVMQEIGLACWHKFDQFSHDGTQEDFVRWCCVIARFEVLRHRRNHARDRLVLSEDIIRLLANDSEARIERAQAERVALEDCLQKLNEPERRLLLSVHTRGDSVARIAGELKQNTRWLYTKLNALRDLVSECVQRHTAIGERS